MTKQVEVGDSGRGKTLKDARDALLAAYDPADVLAKIHLPAGAKSFTKIVKDATKGHPDAVVKFAGDRALILSR